MTKLEHRFVDLIPDEIEDGVIYISMQYCTAIHKCACGCGNEVVTPISPRDWKLFFDGVSITLSPSIGNWSFKCRSHYWIRNSEIQYLGQLKKSKIHKNKKNQINNKACRSQNKHDKGIINFIQDWFHRLFI